MAFELGSIIARVKADTTQFKAGLASAQGGMGKFGGAIRGAASMALKMLPAIGIAAAAITFKKAIDSAASFETKMANISTLISGDSTEAINGLRDGILSMTRSVPKSADELGASAYDILSAGVKGTANQLSVLESSSKLAVAGLGDTKGATDLMTSSINAFGLDAKDSNKISDILFKTVKNGKTTVDELSGAFGASAPILAAAGISLEEFSAATAALTTTGMPASQAQNSLRQATVSLNKPTADMTKLLKEAGYESGQAALEQDGLVGVMAKLNDVAGGNSEVLGKAWGSVEALGAATSLSGDQAGAFNDTLKDMTEGGNAVDEAFEKQSKTFENTKKVLGNLVNEGFIRLGNKVLPIVTTALQWLIDNLPKIDDKFKQMAEFVSRNAGTLKVIAGVITTLVAPALIGMGVQAVVAAAKTTVAFVGMTAKAVAYGVVSKAQALIAGWAWILQAAKTGAAWLLQFGLMIARAVVAGIAMAAPVIAAGLAMIASAVAVGIAWLLAFWPIIAIIAVVAAAAFMVIKNWDKVKAFMGVLWKAIKAIFSGFINFVRSAVTTIVRWVMAYFRLWIGFYKGLINTIISIVRGIINGFKNIFTKAVDKAKEVINKVKGFIKNMVQGVKDALSGVKNALSQPFQDAVDKIRGIVDGAKNVLNKLNPFHRESPSLVDWIKKGTAVIVGEYDSMFNAMSVGAAGVRADALGTSRSVANLTPAQLNGSSQARGAGAGGNGGVTNIYLNGVLADSPEAKRRLGEDIVRHINHTREAKGRNRL